MEQVLRNTDFSKLFSHVLFFLWHIRTKGFPSFLLHHFQSLFTIISHCCNSCSSSSTVDSNSTTQNQSPNIVGKVERLTKEEVIMVMGGLGLDAESSEWEGLEEEIGEEEVEALFEKEPSFAELKDAFEVFDENGDGFIEARELQRVLKCLGMERGIDQCKDMINRFDENGDGLIDCSEFVKFMEQRFEA